VLDPVALRRHLGSRHDTAPPPRDLAAKLLAVRRQRERAYRRELWRIAFERLREVPR
jgi:hypothetical protein